MFVLQCVELSIDICSTNLSNSNSITNADQERPHLNGVVGDALNLKCLQNLKYVIEELQGVYKLISCNPMQEIPQVYKTRMSVNCARVHLPVVIADYVNGNCYNFQNVFSGVESSRFFLYAKSFYLPLFIDTMLFVHDFCSHYLTESCTEEQLQQMADSCGTTFSKIITESNENLKAMQTCQSEVNYRSLLEHLSLVVEVSHVGFDVPKVVFVVKNF
jgi:hypothetical protein